MLLTTFEGTEFSYHKFFCLPGFEDGRQGDFSLRANGFESDDRLKLGRIVVFAGVVEIDELFWFYDFEEADAVVEVSAVGAVHDVNPFASRANIHFAGSVGETIRTPPFIYVLSTGPNFEDQFARGI